MDSPIEIRLAKLESLLGTYEAEREIRRTMDQYAHSIDYGEHERWLDCFTADAVWETHARDGAVVRLSGKAQLEERIRNYPSPPESYRKHMYWTPVITFESDSMAKVIFYFAALLENAGRPYLSSFGRNHDHYRRCDDGRWRLCSRIAEIEVAQPDSAASGDPSDGK
jgi:hypothetical protein